jgi:glycerol-3-phosphate dehydrogenase
VLRQPGAAARFGLDDDVFAALVARHGGDTPALLDLADGRHELLEPLVPGLVQLKVEALWAARHEMAMTVDDVLARRTRASMRRAAAAAGTAPEVAALLAAEWGRDPADAEREAGAFAEAARADLTRAGLDSLPATP